MNKDTGWLIILLLLGADMIAALSHFGGLWQDDLPKQNIYATSERKPIPQPTGKVAKAESEVIVPDEFKTISDEAFFRTIDYVDSAYATRHYEYCAKRADLQWPEAINGERRLNALWHVLIEKLFGTSSDNVYLALENNVHAPTFPSGEAKAVEHSVIPDNESHLHTYRSRHSLKACLSSDRLLVFEIRVFVDNGSGMPSAITSKHCYVAFDKQRSLVLEQSDIITNTKTVLSLINNEIDRRNSHGGNLKQALRLPNFSINRTGLTFVFPAHEIGYAENGETAISLSYKKLSGCLSPQFLDIIQNDGNYQTFSTIQ